MQHEAGLIIEIEYEFRADPGPSISLDELLEVMRSKNMEVVEVNRAGNYLVLKRGKDYDGLFRR